MKIGVFDSGIGGEAVAQQLSKLIPDADIVSVNDHEHVPYGSKSEAEITQLTDAAIQPLLKSACDVIVIACNTATAVAIDGLREKYPDMKFVGLEPMVKPAAELTKTKHIAVLATPATLASTRYSALKHKWAEGVDIEEPDCHDWASLIEHGKSADIPVESVIEALIAKQVDVVVLGCTHYHHLIDRIEAVNSGRITLLEPSDAIRRRIQQITAD